jgi:hypothetical protein
LFVYTSVCLCRASAENKTPIDRRAFILHYVDWKDVLTQTDLKQKRYRLPPCESVADSRVCQRFFADVFEINSSFCDPKKTLESAGRDSPSPKQDAIRQWLGELEQFHEYMPDTVGAGRAVEHDGESSKRTGVMIPYPSKLEVWQAYKDDIAKRPRMAHTPFITIATMSYFLSTWNFYLPHIKLRKHMRFSKCDTCVELRTKIGAFENRDEKLRLKYRAEFREHLAGMKRERLLYHQKRTEAATFGSDTLSIIFDGADQGAYGECDCASQCSCASQTDAVAHLLSCCSPVQAFLISTRRAKAQAGRSSKNII